MCFVPRFSLFYFWHIKHCFEHLRPLTSPLFFLNLLQLGGLNSMLSVEHTPSIPVVSKVPTIILGMDVSHGSPGHSDCPSIAAVFIVTFSGCTSLILCLKECLENLSF